MAERRMQVDFRDSSDDDASHTAALDVVPDGDHDEHQAAAPHGHRSRRRDGSASGGGGGGDCRKQQAGTTDGGGGGGWFSNAVVGAVNRFVGPGEPAREPYGAPHPSDSGGGSGYEGSTEGGGGSHNDNRSAADSADFGYGVMGRNPYSDSTTTVGTSETGTTTGSTVSRDGGGEENFQINLREAVLQYLRTPEELYINIILATLKTGTTQVNADVFRAAAGCPLLVKTFLDSGYADLDDPAVHDILQHELDMVLDGDPYHNEMFEADQADYLRCLCNVKSLRINQRQLVLMRYSGFEFIKMLFDCPHLRSDMVVSRHCLYAMFRVTHIVNITASWLNLLVNLVFTASVIWMAVNWFRTSNQRNNGFWTLICYGAGYVVMLVSSLRAEQDKVKQYENQIWPYPDNNLIIIPVVPVFQIALVITALRYEVAADKVRFFVLRYDLRNGVAIQLICHGLCHAIPQTIVQLFLFTERETEHKSQKETVCFWLLIGSASASFFMAVFAYVRTATFCHSCDTFGFAVLFVLESGQDAEAGIQRIKPSDIATRFLMFFTVAMFVAAAVTLFIFLLNIQNCSASARVFLAVFFAVTGLTILAWCFVVVHARFSRLYGLFSVPMLIMMVAYFPFTKVHSQSHDGTSVQRLCSLFVYHFATWVVPLFVMFGGGCLTFLVWVGMLLYEAITHRRIQQEIVDTFLES